MTSGGPELVRSLEQLKSGLAESPVIASLVGGANYAEYLASTAKVCVVANVAIGDLSAVVRALAREGKFVFVNVDSCPGLGQDKGGLEYVQSMNVPGIISTRTALVQRAKALGMVTIQKVFVTDRSNLPRSLKSVESSRPHMVELMPWPVVPFIEQADLRKLSPFVAAGFVTSPTDVAMAINRGAVAVGTSDRGLWAMGRSDFAAYDTVHAHTQG